MKTGKASNTKTHTLPKNYIKGIFLAILLLVLGLVFSGTVEQWLHEGGHWLGAILTGSQIKEVNLWPPWNGYVRAVPPTAIFYLGGFILSLFIFLPSLVVLITRKSRWAYFMLFPFFQIVGSSYTDLETVGLHLPEFVAFHILGWFLPIVSMMVLFVYYQQQKGVEP